MKKMIVAFAMFLVFSLFGVSVCYAGDVPESILHSTDAQLYFGKVMKVTDTSITILPIQKVKGDVALNVEITYTKGDMVGAITKDGKYHVGKTYLIAYIDENNLYYWQTDSMDTKSLKIKNASAMDLRLQLYLNNGDIEAAEETRLQSTGIKATPPVSPTNLPTPSPTLSPTSLSIPSPVNNDLSAPATPGASSGFPTTILIITFILLGVLVLLMIMRKNKKNKK